MTIFPRNSLGQAVLVAAALSVSSLACAEAYVGGSIGQSMTKFDSSDFTVPGITTSHEKTKTAYKLFAGYNFNPSFAIEGGYADLGKPSSKFISATETVPQTQKESAWFVAGKGTLPINEQFNLFGKLGLTQNKVSASWSDSTGSGSGSDSRNGVLYGIGAEYNVTKQVGIRLEYEDFGQFGSTATGRTNTSAWSAGMTYKF
ncbi:MAG: outer membrane beta-barrel protein [Sulfuricella sp.]|nr:outer membrane beta-barrel protein [Sulfuricella sp.]